MIGPAARDGWRCAWKEISRSSAAWWRSLVRNVRSDAAIVAGARSPRLAPRKLAPWRLLEFFTGRVSRPSPQCHLHAPCIIAAAARDVSLSRLVFLFQAYLPARHRTTTPQFSPRPQRFPGFGTRFQAQFPVSHPRMSSYTRTLFEAATRAGALKNIHKAERPARNFVAGSSHWRWSQGHIGAGLVALR